MGTLISVVVISLFISIVLVNKIDISWYMKNWLYNRFERPLSKRLKPFDCLPCFTFWMSIIVSFILQLTFFPHAELFTFAVSIMAAYVAAFAIQK
jgi:hypothetical protein